MSCSLHEATYHPRKAVQKREHGLYAWVCYALEGKVALRIIWNLENQDSSAEVVIVTNEVQILKQCVCMYELGT